MSTHLVKIQVKMQVLSTLAQPCSSSSSSQCWEQCPGTDKGNHAPLCKELLLWLCCRAGSLRGGQISGVLYHVRGLEAPMAADLGVRGAGSPVGRGCFSSSGCWPASVLPAAAATVVLYSQFFKQRFCYSNEIMTKRPSILIGSARITGRTSGSMLHLLRKHRWVPAALLSHISASLPQHTNKFRKQGCSSYVRQIGEAHRKISH